VSEGNLVVLFFDKLQVLHLINHAEASPEHRPTYFETTAGPALWLVGDKGIYLMSNGAPAMLANGELDASGGQKSQRLFVCYAEGCHREDDPVEYWWPIHNAVSDGDDFSITVDQLAEVRDVIERSYEHIVLVTDGDACKVYTESEFSAAYPAAS
jgi:hypothetical protein